MKWLENEALPLGADVVQRLIPHRRPLLMVDRVLAFRRAPKATLWAERCVSANEEVFAGHFPGLHLWPGVYTIEGLGQTSLLLAVVLHLVATHEANGATGREVLDGLAALDPARARPLAKRHTAFLEDLQSPHARAGMAGQVQMKFLAPVYAGQMLGYRVEATHTMDSLARFEVEAEVDGVAVARGTMTGVFGAPFGGP